MHPACHLASTALAVIALSFLQRSGSCQSQTYSIHILFRGFHTSLQQWDKGGNPTSLHSAQLQESQGNSISKAIKEMPQALYEHLTLCYIFLHYAYLKKIVWFWYPPYA